MSGGRFKSNNANNTPLAPRPPRPGGGLGPPVSSLGGGGGGLGGSLLNPDYLKQTRDEPPSGPPPMMGMGGPPPMGMPPPPGPPPASAHSFKPPPGIVGATEADEEKRNKAMETIMKFNAEQARKRAATGSVAETSEPPMIGDPNAVCEDQPPPPGQSAEEARAERKRKRKSRWGGGETDKTFIPGMPTMMPKGLSREQEEAYLLQLKIEDASRRLRSGDMGIPLNPEERSPSPEPIYSSDGKRLNTREYRKRKELEETRHNSITRMLVINPEYKPPPDYKPPMIKVSDKVMIPQEDFPHINFVGLLIGPRGNTLKAMERDTGAKIIIRGKGSVKEGKVGRKDGQPLPGEDEPLHAYVTAINPEAVKKAVDKIKEVIKQGVDVPEGQNDLRKTQLRELALLNGTLREGEGPRCTNCGAADHKSWQCQDKPNLTNNIVCSTCGGAGHIAKDCVGRRPGTGFGADGAAPGEKTKMDDEYMSLMAELGEGPAPAPSADKDAKPWQRAGPGPFHRPHGPPRPLMGPGHFGRGRGGGHQPPPPPGEFNDFGGGGGGGGGGNWRQKPPGIMGGQGPPPWSQGSRGGWNQPPPPGAQPPPPGHGPPPRGAPPPVQYPGHGPPPPPGGNGYGLPPPYMGGPPPAPPSSSSGGSGQWNSGGGSWSGGPPPPGPPGTGSGYGSGGWQGQGGWSGGGPAPVAPPRPGGSSSAGGAGLSLSSLVSAPPPPPPPS